MRIFREGKVDIFSSTDQWKEALRRTRALYKKVGGRYDTGTEVHERVRPVLHHRPQYLAYIELYGWQTGLQGIAVLDAHGDCDEKGRWTYCDGKKICLVQSWIDKCDGKYASLFCCVCNPASLTPRRTKKSLLVIPDGAYSIRDLKHGERMFSLIHPTKAELDDIIKYEYEVEKRSL